MSETYGDATDDTRFVVFSATKAFVAAAFWMVIADGLVDEHQRVTDFIPEFGTNGKEQITVEQVMLHTSGFPYAPLGPPQQWTTRRTAGGTFAQWRLNWEPGSTYEYHPSSAHWVLAEIMDRVTGPGLLRRSSSAASRHRSACHRVLGVARGEQGGVAHRPERRRRRRPPTSSRRCSACASSRSPT